MLSQPEVFNSGGVEAVEGDEKYCTFSDASWIESERAKIAEVIFSKYDFGSLSVKDTGGWRVSGDALTLLIFFEALGTDVSIQRYLTVVFLAGSTIKENVLLSEAKVSF